MTDFISNVSFNILLKCPNNLLYFVMKKSHVIFLNMWFEKKPIPRSLLVKENLAEICILIFYYSK